jgi:hypothetical protein
LEAGRACNFRQNNAQMESESMSGADPLRIFWFLPVAGDGSYLASQIG